MKRDTMNAKAMAPMLTAAPHLKNRRRRRRRSLRAARCCVRVGRPFDCLALDAIVPHNVRC